MFPVSLFSMIIYTICCRFRISQESALTAREILKEWIHVTAGMSNTIVIVNRCKCSVKVFFAVYMTLILASSYSSELNIFLNNAFNFLRYNYIYTQITLNWLFTLLQKVFYQTSIFITSAMTWILNWILLLKSFLLDKEFMEPFFRKMHSEDSELITLEKCRFIGKYFTISSNRKYNTSSNLWHSSVWLITNGQTVARLKGKKSSNVVGKNMLTSIKECAQPPCVHHLVFWYGECCHVAYHICSRAFVMDSASIPETRLSKDQLNTTYLSCIILLRQTQVLIVFTRQTN